MVVLTCSRKWCLYGCLGRVRSGLCARSVRWSTGWSLSRRLLRVCAVVWFSLALDTE